MPRSVAVLQYWIISTGLRRSNYGVSTLSLDDGGTFRQPITTQHLEATTGMFTFFCAVVFMQCLVCLLFILIAGGYLLSANIYDVSTLRRTLATRSA